MTAAGLDQPSGLVGHARVVGMVGECLAYGVGRDAIRHSDDQLESRDGSASLRVGTPSMRSPCR